MSWGIRITALYVGFVALILTLVTISNNNKEELVSKDYYIQELQYQNRIDAMNNVSSLSGKGQHSVENDLITIVLPSEFKGKEVQGEVFFFCPASSANDVKIVLKTDTEGKQIISKNSLKKGAYKMNLSWSCDGKNYFQEEYITIK